MHCVNEHIDLEYQRVLTFAAERREALPGYFHDMTAQFANGVWREYLAVLEEIPTPLAGKRVVDFGCKFGHLIPLLVAVGCPAPVGLEAAPDYVRTGQLVFETLYPGVRVLPTEDGYMPLQPESVDVVLMNEVISHVNPAFLDTVWAEAARVLKPGGILFVSDGNNSVNQINRKALPDLYDKWENGPEGARTDRDVVTEPFCELRLRLISSRHPALDREKIEFLARNTSGLFGTFLLKTIDRYVETGNLVLRPYRRGTCPTNPTGGYVMERAFDPALVISALAEYGFHARQIVYGADRPRFVRPGLIGRTRDFLAWLKARWWYSLHLNRGRSRGFQIAAVKD